MQSKNSSNFNKSKEQYNNAIAMMSWVGCLLKDPGLLSYILENSQILLKISVIPIFLTFMYLVQLNKYKTDPYFLQYFQSNTQVCLIIRVFCKSSDPEIVLPVLQIKTKTILWSQI